MLKKLSEKLRLLLRIVFSRTAIIFLMLFIQLAVFFASIQWLSDYTAFIYGTFTLLSVLVIIHIMNEENNASFKMVWIIPVLVIPIFGTLMYIYVNMQVGTKRMHKRLTAIEKQTQPLLKQNEQSLKELYSNSVGEKGLASYLHNANSFPVYSDCGMKYYPLGEDKFADMLSVLKSAKKFIFMEYFIVAEGKMWNTILDILRQKVKEGVEVRFMYDGMCSLVNLPYGYYKKLESMGIQSIPFSQIKPVFTTYQNNRDHRKILVVDGETAFTGGINLADEYINEKTRFGHWKDTAVMICGEAVKSYTLMFLKCGMWQSNIPLYRKRSCKNMLFR